jgi:hypothetical protein
VPNTGNIESVAVAGYLYWTASEGTSIDRAKLDGTGMTKIVKGLNNPFAFDVVADPKGTAKAKGKPGHAQHR